MLQDVRRELEEWQSETFRLKAELAEASATAKQSEDKASAIQQLMMTKEPETATEDAARQINTMQQTCTRDLAAARRESATAVAAANAAFDQLRTESHARETAAAAAADMTCERNVLQAELEDLKLKMSGVGSERIRLHAGFNVLNSEIERLRGELDGSRDDLVALHGDAQKLRLVLDTSNGEAGALRSERRWLKQELLESRSGAEKLQEHQLQLKLDLDAARHTAELLGRDQQRLQSELDEAKDDGNRMLLDQQRLKEELQQGESARDDLQQKNTSLIKRTDKQVRIFQSFNHSVRASETATI